MQRLHEQKTFDACRTREPETVPANQMRQFVRKKCLRLTRVEFGKRSCGDADLGGSEGNRTCQMRRVRQPYGRLESRPRSEIVECRCEPACHLTAMPDAVNEQMPGCHIPANKWKPDRQPDRHEHYGRVPVRSGHSRGCERCVDHPYGGGPPREGSGGERHQHRCLPHRLRAAAAENAAKANHDAVRDRAVQQIGDRPVDERHRRSR